MRLVFAGCQIMICALFMVQAKAIEADKIDTHQSKDTALQLSASDKIRASYLFHFTKFIEWPEPGDRFARTSIDICLWASESFLRYMSELAAQKNNDEDPTPVAVTDFSAQSRCDMIYVQQSDFSVTPQFEEVLLVASAPTILPDQATITFYEEESPEEQNRLRFEVDMQEVERLKLNISSELLKLARVKKP